MKKVLVSSMFILLLMPGLGLAWDIQPFFFVEQPPYNISCGGYFPDENYAKCGNGYYDYRDIQYGFPNKCGMMGGEFFGIGIMVKLNTQYNPKGYNPKLTDLSQIEGCKAKALSNNMQFSMSRVEQWWLGWPLQFGLMLRPESWMFETDWEITLRYKANWHWYVQKIIFPATGRLVRPGRPANIKIERDPVDPSIVLVKAAPIAPACDLAPGVRYSPRLRIYDENCGVFAEIRTVCELPTSLPPYYGDWDFQTYELVFKIPYTYVGLGARLEYRLQDIVPGMQPKTIGRSVVQFPIELTE
jgi:hypothetical protein